MQNAADLTAAQASRLIRARELSPTQIVAASLERIRELDPHLHAWVTVDGDNALAVAHVRERELARGEWRGPLHGIPFGVKDVFYTSGMRTTACSRLLQDFVPTFDAAAVARLRVAGAILLGKTVTTEFATADPSMTRNPWDDRCTPGGSSSGSAVAVASRMCPIAIGTQTGGSTLRPAAYNGAVGLKPTFGLISMRGVIPVSWSLDTVGIFARTTEDAALALDALVPERREPSASDRLEQIVDASDGASQEAGWRPRIGVVRDFFYSSCSAAVQGHTELIVNHLAAAGAATQVVRAPTDLAAARAIQLIIDHVECATFHEASFRDRQDDYGPQIRRRIATGLLIPGVRYVEAQRAREGFGKILETMFDGVDVLLTPSTPAAAPRDLTTTGNPIFQSIWSLCGFPAISLPSGLDPSGMPLGVQLVAPKRAESRLLQTARWCEAKLNVALTPPIVTSIRAPEGHR